MTRLLIWLVQIAMFTASMATAYLVRFEFQVPSWAIRPMVIATPIAALAKAAVFFVLRLDRGRQLYGSAPDAVRIALGNLAGSGLAALILTAVMPATVPGSVYIIDFLLCLQGTTGMRLLVRRIADRRSRIADRVAGFVEGAWPARQIREVAVEDLLGRSPVQLDTAGISGKLEGKTVLVTGAAGSIGAELCRQIARFRPRALIALEIAETALFHLEREMRAAFPGLPFRPEIGSVQNRSRLDEVFEAHRPQIVFHAAAYKHVPMMERHLFEAFENNVLGTHNAAATAQRHGASDFVMISSDKAVRPTSIMGLTKRAAEILVHSLQDGETKFVSVRFGNVLGSNGSVVSIFKQQIAAGGPVTVTDREMRRYFMTIAEAAQLVLQASSMGRGGEIFVLDMGEPVKIVDLATNLILLSGLRPGEDIKIEFTGVRPGEKLYEELSAYNENTLATYHEKIKIFAGDCLVTRNMEGRLEVLKALCEVRDARYLLLELKDMAPEYNPSANVLRLLQGEEADEGVWTANQTSLVCCLRNPSRALLLERVKNSVTGRSATRR